MVTDCASPPVAAYLLHMLPLASYLTMREQGRNSSINRLECLAILPMKLELLDRIQSPEFAAILAQ